MSRAKHNLYRTLDYHESTLLHRQGDRLFESLVNGLSGERIPFGGLQGATTQGELDGPLLVVSMPGYMKGRYAPGGVLNIKTIKTFPGSLMELKAYPNYKSYLDRRFNGKQRAQFRTSKALLEHCFEIEHRVFFGAIEKQEYDRLFEALKAMQLARLALMGSADDSAGMWALYQESAYRQILDRQACISVIYHRERPIAISLNFILGKIVHGFTRSFDMAYSKFGLGNIELLNMVEWCFEQNFEVLDCMKGEYHYKNKFTDTSYDFTIQLVYDKGFGQKLKGLSLYYGLSAFYALYHALRSVGFLKLWHALSRGREKKPSSQGQVQLKEYEQIGQDPMEVKGPMVDWSEVDDPDIRRAICELCHKHKMPLKNISLFSNSESPYALILKQGSQMWSIMENETQNNRPSKL